MIVIAITLSWIGRILWLHRSRFPIAHTPGAQSSQTHLADHRVSQFTWASTLVAFLCPPLLLWMTAIAILCMGHHGRMMGNSVGWISCVISGIWCSYGGLLLLYALWQAWRSQHALRQCSPVTLLPERVPQLKATPANLSAYVLESNTFFAAQMGGWRSNLILSTSLLSQLPLDQLQAVLLHEQAHAHYRDCFWFFWLGWLRRMTAWMPATDALWHDLLLLRELRADSWAAQVIDRLVLAETLLHISAQQMLTQLPSGAAIPDVLGAWLHGSRAAQASNGAIAPCTCASQRLDLRIEALLAANTTSPPTRAPSLYAQGISWLTLASSCTPLLTLPLHH